MTTLTEADVEAATLAWLSTLAGNRPTAWTSPPKLPKHRLSEALLSTHPI